MSLFKRFTNFIGMNTRENSLNTPEGYVTDSRNMVSVNNGSIQKRRGYGNVGATIPVGGSLESGLIGGALYPGTTLLSGSVSVGTVNNSRTGRWLIVSTPTTTFANVSNDQHADYVEYNGVGYIARSNNFLQKFDSKVVAGFSGGAVYNAGMFPLISEVTDLGGGSIDASTGYDALSFLRILDNFGNETLSAPSYDSGSPGSSSSKIQFQRYFYGATGFLRNEGWMCKYVKTNPGTTSIDWASSATSYVDVTIPILAQPALSISLNIGDLCYQLVTITDYGALGTTYDSPLICEVVGFTGGVSITIRIQKPSERARTGVVKRPQVAATYSLISNCISEYYYSAGTGATTYRPVGATLVTGGAISYRPEDLQFQYDHTFDYVDLNQGTLLEPDGDNILPPSCKYVEVHEGVLFLANGGYINGVDSTSNSTVYAPVVDVINTQMIFYCSLGAGTSGVESFRIGDNLIIGYESEGEITGLRSFDGQLIVFKERAIYFVTGNETSNLRVRGIYGSNIGCLANGSIQEIAGSVFFLGENGVYAVRGGSFPVDVSLPISDIIIDAYANPSYIFSKASSCHDVKRRQYILHIPHAGNNASKKSSSITLCFDYYRKGWWRWSNIDAYGGISMINDEVYFIDVDGNRKKMQDGRADDGTAFNGYIESRWEDVDEPSIPKKFLNLKIFNTNSTDAHTDTVTTYIDYKSAIDTNRTITIQGGTTPFEKIKLNAGLNKAHAMKFRIANNNPEVMEISGYEIEYEAPFRKMKA
jgi:hypothetical protein